MLLTVRVSAHYISSQFTYFRICHYIEGGSILYLPSLFIKNLERYFQRVKLPTCTEFEC